MTQADTDATTAGPPAGRILRAIADPAAFLPRGSDSSGDPCTEPIPEWSARAVREVILDWLIDRRAAETAPAAPVTPIGADAGLATLDIEDASLLDLHYGQRLVILRYTEPLGSSQVRCEMPCCPKDGPVKARAVDLPVDLDHEGVELAVCPSHRVSWRVALIDEGDGGFLARFELAGRVAVAAQRRTYGRPL